MELVGLVLVSLVILGHFLEGFALVNFIQFFRGKETLLEKMAKKNQKKKT
jgi:hypothetical protein